MLLATCEHLGERGDWFPRVASGFGGGIGRTGQVCGAISGAVIGAGWVHGKGSDGEDRDILYDISGSLIRSFTSRFGTTLCRDLIGFDLGDPEDRGKAFESGVFAERCAGFVRFCAEQVNEHFML